MVCEGKNDPLPEELDRALPNDGKLLNPFTDPEDNMLVLPLPVLLLPLKPKPRSEDGAGDLGAKREAFHCEGLVDILLSYRRLFPDEKRGSTQGIVKTTGGIVLLGFGGLLH